MPPVDNSCDETSDSDSDSISDFSSDEEAEPLEDEPQRKKSRATHSHSKNGSGNMQKDSGSSKRHKPSKRTAKRQPLVDRNLDPPTAPRKTAARVPASPPESDDIEELQKMLKTARSMLAASQARNKRLEDNISQMNDKPKRKRGNSDAEGNAEPRPAAKELRIDEQKQKQKQARDTGKRFVLQCDLWADHQLLFGPHSDCNPSVASEPIEPPVLGLWSLQTDEDREHYIRFKVREFRSTLTKRELAWWEKPWFQREFKEGARKFRTGLLDGTENRPVEVFGIKSVSSAKFAMRRNRANIREVKQLLDDNRFLEADAEEVYKLPRAYRGSCLLKILRRMWWGQKAVVSGEPSEQARGVYAKKFKPKTVTLSHLATAATLAMVILDGTMEFSEHSQGVVNYYWDRLHVLNVVDFYEPDRMEAIIEWYNQQLGFKSVDEERTPALMDPFTSTEARMLKKLHTNRHYSPPFEPPLPFHLPSQRFEMGNTEPDHPVEVDPHPEESIRSREYGSLDHGSRPTSSPVVNAGTPSRKAGQQAETETGVDVAEEDEAEQANVEPEGTNVAEEVGGKEVRKGSEKENQEGKRKPTRKKRR